MSANYFLADRSSLIYAYRGVSVSRGWPAVAPHIHELQAYLSS